MSINNINIYAEVSSLANAIATSSISREKYHLLSKQLDNALNYLQQMETQGKVHHLFHNLKETLVNLYKDLEDGLVRTELSKIQAGSLSLRQGRISRQAIRFIEKRVKQLEQNYSGSVPEKRILAEAKEALAQAKLRLCGLVSKKQNPLFTQERQGTYTEETFLYPGEVEQLFEIAEAIYYNRPLTQAKSRYNTLPEEHKSRIQHHLGLLSATLFENPIETMQALIATANDLVENHEGYPSLQQLHSLFLGLSEIQNTEERKIIRLTTNALKAHGG